MHLPLRYLGFGCLPLLLGFIGVNPTYWFFVFYLIAHPTWRSLGLAFLGTAVGVASLQVAGMYCSRIRSAAELRRDARLRNGELVAVIIGSLKGIIPDEQLSDIASARVEKSPLWHRTAGAKGNEVYIFVYRADTPDAPWTPGSAFLGSVGQRVAILRDDPLRAIRPWSRFLLLHEIAHVTSEGVGLQVARWRYMLTTVHAVVTICVLGPPWGHNLLIALMMVGLFLSVQSFRAFERLCEAYADAAAFRGLSTVGERQRVLDLIEHEIEAAASTFGEKHFHTRLWRDRLRSLNNPRRFSLFTLGSGTIFDPSLLPFVLVLIAGSILAWHSHIASGRYALVYAIWCACCQIVAIILQVWAKRADAQILIALHGRMFPSDEERRI